MKYPIGIQSFSEVRNGGYVYVDKTMYVRELIDSGKYYFLSRPRRFGKSLLLSTIEAYFKGLKELFEGLAIAQTETQWIQYPIIRIDFASMETTSPKGIVEDILMRLRKIAKTYSISIPDESWKPSSLFAYLVETLHEITKRQVVVLIDEYDKGIIETLNEEEKNKKALDILRPFFSVLKSHDEHIRFAFITGVSRFRNTTIFSGFNNPTDISLDNDYANILGITQEEINAYLQEGIRKIAETNDFSIEKAKEVIRNKYDGYRFTARKTYVYNPFSLFQAMRSGQLDDYWVMSGTSRILVEYLRESGFSLDELTSRWVLKTDLGSTYSKTDPLSLFFQTGYLTISEYDGFGSFRLRIPNQEVQATLVNLLIPEFVIPSTKNDISQYQIRLQIAIKKGDVDDMMNTLRSLISSVPYQEIDIQVLERHIHLCMYIIFMMLGVSTRCEQASAAGRVDMVAETPWRVYVMEFKIDGTPQQALGQINSKGYAIPWEAHSRTVIKIGVNFSSSLQTIESWEYTQGLHW